MTNNYGELLEDGSIRFERLLPGPIERVWSWFADGDKRALWLSGGGTATAAGESIKFDFHHKTLTPHDEPYPEAYKEMENGVSHEVEITLFEPPHRLSWHWPSPDGMDVDVDITLREEGDKVRLILVQRGEVTPDHMVGSSAGWHVHLAIMIDKLNGDIPAPFWAAHEEKVGEYKKRFGV